ncbi:TatD family hydrolase [Halpernia frigidisoli]|uniref:TatD DNase family protein n=1 Tax=Halpernia frigidisoli TaxID=1125876 RepID=A0A1I3HU03_9FLAO|nr:TatD family hydrolase [Halpernia frigidisoli]SFI39010.1 TatD DNase family protein [Halpernia frigidisoli]
MGHFNFHHHFLAKTGIYNLNFKENIPDSIFSAGIHPKDILPDFKSQLLWLKKIAENKNCVAIGECGLDSLVEINLDLQKEAFLKQIYLANELQKPVIIHCVRQFQEVLRMKQFADIPMVFHGFNKKSTLGNQLSEKGFYFSFGRSLLQNVDLQLFFKYVPLEKFFLETDAAEIDIDIIYQKAAEIKDLKIEDLNEIIDKNLQTIGINI